jgi:hypothetical protein
MNSSGTKKSPPAHSKFSTNPFARALAETEKSSFGDSASPQNPFAEMLAKNNGLNRALQQPGLDQGSDSNSFANAWAEEQRLSAEKQVKKEALRKKLHDQVNPVDTLDVFNAREKQVKEEIEQIRYELKLLVKDMASLNKEIDMTLMSNTAEPGISGKYYINFFQQLRAWILLLRQKVNSARSWATQFQNKQSKKKKRGGAFVFDDKSGHEKTKAVFDTMHHEVSNATSGG